MDVRAVSSALDTVLFVLLVGAAIAVLGGLEGGEDPRSSARAHETADVLATSTTTIDVGGPNTVARQGETAASRSRHGTHAELLAVAAATEPDVDEGPLVPRAGGYRRAVGNTTRRALGSRESVTSVRAVWRPYPDAPVSGEFRVGPTPPPSADVAATTIVVPSGYPNVTDAARAAAARDGYEGVARVLAEAVVRGLFPPNATRTALRSEGPDARRTAARYERASDALNVSLVRVEGPSDVDTANRRLVAGLRLGFERDLRAKYDSPRAAAAALEPDRVRIAVRTWSP